MRNCSSRPGARELVDRGEAAASGEADRLHVKISAAATAQNASGADENGVPTMRPTGPGTMG